MIFRNNILQVTWFLLFCLAVVQAAPEFKPKFRRHMIPGMFSQESRQGRNSKLMQFGRSFDEPQADPLSLLNEAEDNHIEDEVEAEAAEKKVEEENDLAANDVADEVSEDEDISEEAEELLEDLSQEVDLESESEEAEEDLEAEDEDLDQSADVSGEMDADTETIVKELAKEVNDEVEKVMADEAAMEEDVERAGKEGEDTIGIHNFDMNADEEKDFKIKLLEDQLKQVRNILSARSNGNFAEPEVVPNEVSLPNEEPVEDTISQEDYDEVLANRGLPSDFATNMGEDLLAEPDNNNYVSEPQLPANRQQAEEEAAQAQEAGEENDEGLRCMKKIMMVEETVYDEIQKCTHSFTEKCSETVMTDFVATQERKCETIYGKNCVISYKPMVFEEDVMVCHEPFETRCSNDTVGETVCNTHYETVCETRYKEHSVEQDEPECRMETEERCDSIEIPVPVEISDVQDSVARRKRSLEYASAIFARSGHRSRRQSGDINASIGTNCEEWPIQKCEVVKKVVKKVNPETSCEKKAREICAPSNCKQVKANKVCNQESRNFVQNIPKEECGLEPREDCRMETVMVPRIVPQKNCFKVPKEICVSQRVPKKEKKPVVTEWCYDPTDLQNQSSGAVLRQIINNKNKM